TLGPDSEAEIEGMALVAPVGGVDDVVEWAAGAGGERRDPGVVAPGRRLRGREHPSRSPRVLAGPAPAATFGPEGAQEKHERAGEHGDDHEHEKEEDSEQLPVHGAPIAAAAGERRSSATRSRECSGRTR